MAGINKGICEKCGNRVPAEHDIRQNSVFIKKNCPDCGLTEALVSTDAAIWQRKREIYHYDPGEAQDCTLNCVECNDHHLHMIFLDVTNRCNMNCPICIANIPSMGFEFNPPLSYFKKVLKALSEMDPKPWAVNLFGGEPTVRDDLFDIIKMGQDYGLDIRLVTNGLRLADEEYCKKICDAGVHVLLAFDGKDPEIYARLRKSSDAYEKKLKALDNLKKFSKKKNTIMCCAARKINDKHMRGLIDFCHENRDYIQAMHLIPLTESWEEGEFEAEVSTTIEDVERIIDEAFPEGKVEFLPMGLTIHLQTILDFLGLDQVRIRGVHPNCESETYVVSDGKRYWPLSRYLKRSLADIGEEVVRRCIKLSPKLKRLDRNRRLHRLWGEYLIFKEFIHLPFNAVNVKAITGGSRLLTILRIIGGLIAGKRPKDLLRKYTNTHAVMLMIVLPFEEPHSVESARLHRCFSGFAIEDPETGEIKTIPTCTWSMYRKEIQKKIAEKYKSSPVTSSA